MTISFLLGLLQLSLTHARTHTHTHTHTHHNAHDSKVLWVSETNKSATKYTSATNFVRIALLPHPASFPSSLAPPPPPCSHEADGSCPL